MSSREIKVITLGPGRAGKTCLLMKAVHKDYVLPTDTPMTIGVDFKIKTYEVGGKQQVNMHIWDTAGQERFYQINRMYYRDASAVLFIFDLTDQDSFEGVDFFWNDFNQFSGSDGTTFKILVGTKSDKPDRQILASAAEAWALRHSVPYMETSALTGDNVEDLFSRVMKACVAQPQKRNSGRLKALPQDNSPRKKKRRWCGL